MFDTYLKLERNAAMERAINRCRKTRLKAHTVSIDARLYLVPSRSIPGTFYVVQFNVANGERFAACNCKAGQRSQVCVHIVVAYVQHVINMAMRRQAEKSAADCRGFAADDAGVLGHHPAPAETSELATPDPVVASPEPDEVRCEDASSGSTPDSEPETDAQTVTVCSICGNETTFEVCLRHPGAADIETTLGKLLDVQSGTIVAGLHYDAEIEAKRALFARLSAEALTREADAAEPVTEREHRRNERENSILTKQPQREVKIDGWGI